MKMRTYSIIVRTGHVYDAYPDEEVQEIIDARNALDEQGHTEVLCSGLSYAEAIERLYELSNK